MRKLNKLEEVGMKTYEVEREYYDQMFVIESDNYDYHLFNSEALDYLPDAFFEHVKDLSSKYYNGN